VAAQSDQPPLVVIVGETSSGKSKLGLELAKRFNGEILCADSWTVRRELDIGTAKPSAGDLAQVPHHLINIVGPDEDFTAAVFKRLANKTIQEVDNRGRLPMLVGGTGLYIDGVIFDYSFLPAGPEGVRQSLSQKTNQELLLLATQHNYSLDNIDIRNKRRLIRLLETEGARPQRRTLRPNTLLLGIKIPRDLLEQRIIERVDAMLQAGLEQEVRRLADSYGFGCEGLKGIGYREWEPYFNGQQDLHETRSKIIKSTLGLAKRQRTWFKRNEQIQWICNLDEAVDLVTTFLNKHLGPGN
jgi:tRNA dimethylallyltransferase